MAERFKTGDQVQLKSGGPTMTVDDVIGGTVNCQWFSGAKLNHGSFESGSLIKVTGKTAGEEKAKD